jgi:hypothetical protein
MSLQLYSQIPGTQVKRDIDLSNATIQCDPLALYPLGATQGGVPLNKENLAGKIAVEHDICNLDVNNLTVNGVLVAKGPAEVCNIVCPVDFNVTADNDITLSAPGPGTGNILLTNQGAGTGAFIDLKSDDSILLQSQGTGPNTLHLEIPTPSGGAADQGTAQLQIQNQANTNAQSIRIRSDNGGVRIDAPSNNTGSTVVIATNGNDQISCVPAGTSIAATGRLGFFSVPLVAQPTNAITAATPFTGNTSGIVDDTATYGGYTVGQIVAALQALGLIA